MKGRDILLRVLYWVAVLAISLAILVGLILLLESRDSSEVGDKSPRTPAALTPP